MWRGIGLFIFFSFNLVAQSAELCNRSHQVILSQFESPLNRLAFQNSGGLFQGGTCWWHSRLQRSAIYLTTYSPDQEKPSRTEAHSIIKSLVHFQKVVNIPGYHNFYEFSRDFRPLIQEELNQWQVRDGFLNQQWIRGAYGRSSMPARTLQRRMSRIYSKFTRSLPGLWVMLQMPGVVSHAFLILEMKKADSGYHLKVIDSNRPNLTREIDYQYGDHSLELGSNPFVPYVGFQNDFKKINFAIQRFCQK